MSPLRYIIGLLNNGRRIRAWQKKEYHKPALRRAAELWEEHKDWAKVAAQLNEEGFTDSKGRPFIAAVFTKKPSRVFDAGKRAKAEQAEKGQAQPPVEPGSEPESGKIVTNLPQQGARTTVTESSQEVKMATVPSNDQQPDLGTVTESLHGDSVGTPAKSDQLIRPSEAAPPEKKEEGKFVPLTNYDQHSLRELLSMAGDLRSIIAWRDNVENWIDQLVDVASMSGDLKGVIDWWKETGGAVNPGTGTVSATQQWHTFKLDRSQGNRGRENTGVNVHVGILREAKAKAKRESRSLSQVVEQLLWGYIGSPSDLLMEQPPSGKPEQEQTGGSE